jgi:hypothetical protein
MGWREGHSCVRSVVRATQHPGCVDVNQETAKLIVFTITVYTSGQSLLLNRWKSLGWVISNKNLDVPKTSSDGILMKQILVPCSMMQAKKISLKNF